MTRSLAASASRRWRNFLRGSTHNSAPLPLGVPGSPPGEAVLGLPCPHIPLLRPSGFGRREFVLLCATLAS